MTPHPLTLQVSASNPLNLNVFDGSSEKKNPAKIRSDATETTNQSRIKSPVCFVFMFHLPDFLFFLDVCKSACLNVK